MPEPTPPKPELNLVKFRHTLLKLVEAIETHPNPAETTAFATARTLLLDTGKIEWTILFIECVARMRVYQRQFFAAKYRSDARQTALENSKAAEAYVDQCLRYMHYVPGRIADPVQSTLFEEKGIFDNDDDELEY
jgi:hypothetical protein